LALAFVFLGVIGSVEAPISDVSPSSSIASTTEEEEGLKLLQTVRLTFGHLVGTEKRGPLP
jgi:hypothetical protein